jgi:hypothetical protein
MSSLFFFVSFFLSFILSLLFIYFFSFCFFPSIKVIFTVHLLAIYKPVPVITPNASLLAYWQHNGIAGK